MKVYNTSDLKTLPLLDEYQYFGLFDQGGGTIIPFNSNKVSGAVRLREIEKRLISQGCRDGYYLIKAKNTPVKNAVCDDFTFYKGEQLSERDQVTPPPPPPMAANGPDVLTYETALKLNVEVEKFKLENAALKRRITELENEVAEMETQAETLSEQPNADMWSNAKSFLSELVQMGAPLLDKHFELKEKALSLQAMRMQHAALRPPQRSQQPTAQPGQQEKIDIEGKIMAYKDTPEIYNELARLYNQAANVEDFLKNLNDYDSEIARNF